MTAVAPVETNTAVDVFARRHAAGDVPEGDRRYRDRVPLTRPRPGQQYGFEVDLDACTGCKACVTACHSLNGLDDDEWWRSVGLLHGVERTTPLQQTVTTSCHHCIDPACLSGCPVDAYEKDPTTGIVIHLDDQCIGCGYCTLTCPYEVPQFNAARGIVRKCDMCTGRLEAGEAPACVQGCPNGAITITLVDTVETVQRARAGGSLVAGGPASAITVPTTVYISRRTEVASLRAADHFSLRPAQAHVPLAVMLVLTQLAVGAVGVDYLAWVAGDMLVPGPLRLLNAAVGSAMGALALGASVLHLGRPRYAFRAVIGVRHSWLSREIIAFAAFAGLVPAYAVARSLSSPHARLPVVLGGFTLALGVAGVACSVMIYAVTHRTWWRVPTTAPKFALTALLCGMATALATGGGAGAGRRVALALIVFTAIKLVFEATVFRHLVTEDATDLKRTALLLTGDLGRSTWWRFGVGAAGGIAVPLVVVAAASGPLTSALAIGGLIAVVAGELMERVQFFAAVTAPRMPGLLR